MCRIAGIISRRLSTEAAAEKVGLMCDALKHGGPDDEGIFSDQEAGLVFGNRRLAIIDLRQNGHQPMSDVQQRVWITFNGEIYNYRELRVLLVKAGCDFHSNTDTEVIVNAYLTWGTEAFAKLRGMFAFALYDKAAGLTYLVRDSTGIKPLYYLAENESLSFASEIKAFKQAGITNQGNPNWPVSFLAYGHIPEPATTLRNVFSLPKGHYLKWNHRTSTSEIFKFFRQADQPRVSDLAEAKDLIRTGLSAAIARQLIADAPIGVFLSGGVDSSLISLIANHLQAQTLKTISIFFNEKAYDERSYQSLVQKHITGEKHIHLVRQLDFEESFPLILNDMDMPTTDGINTWFISKYAHEDGLKAVLSGVGADELFGGYPSFNRIKYIGFLRQWPTGLFSAAKYFQKDKYRKVAFLARNHQLADYLLLRGLFVPGDIAKILNMDGRQVEEILFDNTPFCDLGPYDEAHAAWFETNLYMQNQLLRDTDVMSMSHGLEVRVPFLDEDFQQMAESLAPGIRFDNQQPKRILVESFKRILPESVWNRRKMGFTFPLQEWMGRHPMISDENLYKGRFAQNAVMKFKKGQVHWSKIFALHQIQSHV